MQHNKDIETRLYLREYIEYFNENYRLLLERYNRFKELRKKGWSLDTETYFDMLLVQLRSLFLDIKGNKSTGIGNYTVQNILTLASDSKAGEKIDTLLNTKMIQGISGCRECLINYKCSKSDAGNCGVIKGLILEQGIRIITDKSICHYDNHYRHKSYGWEVIQMLKKMLSDENEKINIDYIIDTLKDVFKDGVTLNIG